MKNQINCIKKSNLKRSNAPILTISPAILCCLLSLPLTSVLADPNFIDNGDGTVTSVQTGLTWQRCAAGQTWTGTTCTGTGDSVLYLGHDALNMTSNFAGHSDWRLPNMTELWSIAVVGFDETVFPNQPDSSNSWYFWTSSIYPVAAANDGKEWLKIMQSGSGKPQQNIGLTSLSGEKISSSFATTLAAIRLVRGQNKWVFTNNGDGTTIDGQTNLMWQRCAMGQTWNGTTCTGNATYENWDQLKAGLNISNNFAGYNDWRLPTSAEMNSIVDHSDRSLPIGDPIAYYQSFPNAPISTFGYWNSFNYSESASDFTPQLIAEAGCWCNDMNSSPIRLVRSTTASMAPKGNSSTSGIFTTQGSLVNADRNKTTLNLTISTTINTTDAFYVWANVPALGDFYYVPTKGWIPFPKPGIMGESAGNINSSTTNINILNGADFSSPIFNQTRIYVVYIPSGANPSPASYGNLIYQIGGDNW